MEIIRSFESMLNHLTQQEERKRVAVVWAADHNSQVSVQRALEAGFIDAIFVGCQKEVEQND
ncbi:MAG: phosphate butyryltransferase, partial [Prevotella sp.]|nr:phosphate butyryltransferase [Prevotella sp.]